MENRKPRKTRKRKKLTRRAAVLYLTLAVCVLGVGVAARTAMNFQIKPQSDETETTEAPTEVQTVRFSAEELTAPAFPDSGSDTETPQETGGVYAPEDAEGLAVAAQEDGIERAASFVTPLDGETDKGFSDGEMVQSATMGDWRVHNGVDFRGAVGDPVKAINNGVVKAVYDDVLWGTVVEIDHSDGLIAKYCGLGKGSTVEVGATVSVNDKVGNLGTIPIEAADETHLHLELWQDDAVIDPMTVFS